MKKNITYPHDSKHQVYFSEIEKLTRLSSVLGNSHGRLSLDRTGLTTELLILKGNANGLFFKGFQSYPSNITICKGELAEIEGVFQNYCKTQIREGKKAVTDWPQGLLDLRLKLEARLIIYEKEVATLEEKLKPFLDQEKTISDRNVLKNGPKGVSQLSGGLIVTIDNMKVSISPEGIPFINDERAKAYNGYSCSDYIEFICNPWAIAKAKQAKLNLLNAKNNGVELDEMTKGKKTGSNCPWPSMPEGCINYLKKELVENSETTTVTRLKK